MINRKRNWLILGGIVLAVVLFAAFMLKGKDAPKYFTQAVQKGDLRQVVEATGTINAVTTVQVGSQVSGTISEIKADFNSRVKKGQLVARIEPSLFEGAVQQARADLENARANLASSKANLVKSRATAAQTKSDYERTAGLAKEGVLSQQQLELAKANYESAAAQVSASDAQVTQAAAQVSQKAAALQVSETNLRHTYIYAPIDGTVINRAVDVGQTVAASLQAPTLFTIAQDLTRMQVFAKTDESDVGQIRAGQRVTFKVDAFPRDTFRGVVGQVRMNPTTVQNVVTYDTVINFDNPELKLFPGMTAYISIPVAQAQNVLKVANGALRYTPDMKPEEVQALLRQNGIELPTRRGGAAGQAGGSAQGMAGGQTAADAGSTGAAGRQRRAAGESGEQPGGGASGGPQGGRRGSDDVKVVWKLGSDKSLKPVQVRTGITDHTYTEVAQVLKGELNDGDQLVTGAQSARGAANRPPTMGAPGGAGGRNR